MLIDALPLVYNYSLLCLDCSFNVNFKINSVFPAAPNHEPKTGLYQVVNSYSSVYELFLEYLLPN